MLRSLYLAVAFGAIALPALAGEGNPVDVPAAQAAGLVRLADTFPAQIADATFGDLDGGEHQLSDWQGQALLVNFWATWCAPCREEMPSLDALQQEMGGDDFQVLTIAAGRNPPEAMRKFFAETGIETLPLLTDPRMELARAMGVVGLPVTVLIDREGREVARLNGEADWASDAALEVVRALKAD
ncbi:MAG: TlpA disulfide reductase family protein [Paracoccus sp. (in: a-proteobacteria)]|uniref:TlpA disulfide reductase family protein n=1 Tax=Paracoccus sp. TaxID=267 RepID=UPI0026E0C4E1|nr:TlpA disulfide reductase family protein [Paracoccus sp. (in: a-proteobacteria)]MDO5612396.1 TlpA disulfide reductase family protein [Paracoccus sp. (in: a-proteobacteria)]MDO5630600.1 TlpA disulfide reductase family protein [Paracoccus sp. (in: a-proteobacteria)]